MMLVKAVNPCALDSDGGADMEPLYDLGNTPNLAVHTS